KVLGRDGDDLVVEGPAGEARLPIGAGGERGEAGGWASGGDAGKRGETGGRGPGDAVGWNEDGVVVVAVGRRRNTDSLGLAPAGFRFPLSASGRALALARPEGYVEIVADRADGTVLGVHMVGAGVAELAAEAALAVEMAATVEDVALTIAPHPTLSEALAEAA